MLTRIKISGFKSFQDFEMEFTPLTVVAGTNASGKSNLFDALMLLSRLAEADHLKKAFGHQRGELLELFTQYDKDCSAKIMSFEVEMLVDRLVRDAWGNEATLKYTRLRYKLCIERYSNENGLEDLKVIEEHLEKFNHSQDPWIKKIDKETLEHWRPQVKTGKRGIPYIETKLENGIKTVIVPQDGVQGGNKRRFPLHNATRTVLSSFDTVDFPHVFAAKEEMKSWKFLQLNPEELRKPTSKKSGEMLITASGANLAAALHRIKQTNDYALTIISRKLNQFLPNFIGVDVVDDLENQQYIIQLEDVDRNIYSSGVLSEGTLRLLTLCIIEQDEKYRGLICFEEPENGIHPYQIKAMVDLLKDLSIDFENIEKPLRQAIINTHSPTLVGYINQWQSDLFVSIWFSQIRNRIINNNNERMKVKVTSILPVQKNGQFSLEFEESDQKLTLHTVQRYLEQDYTPSTLLHG